MENERRNRLEADKKAGDEKKKAAKELHEAKIRAVMQAAAAGSPSLSQEDSAPTFCLARRDVPADVLILPLKDKI